jgi:hypothetical protein
MNPFQAGHRVADTDANVCLRTRPPTASADPIGYPRPADATDAGGPMIELDQIASVNAANPVVMRANPENPENDPRSVPNVPRRP